MPHQYCVVPVATGVLKSHPNEPGTVGALVGVGVGASVGAADEDAQMVNPDLVTLPSERQFNGVPATIARLLISAGVVSRVLDVPTVK
jgi:hypothetical protein